MQLHLCVLITNEFAKLDKSHVFILYFSAALLSSKVLIFIFALVKVC